MEKGIALYVYVDPKQVSTNSKYSEIVKWDIIVMLISED